MIVFGGKKGGKAIVSDTPFLSLISVKEDKQGNEGFF